MSTATQQKWEGRWDQVKGRLKEAWGVLTDDELDELQGDYDQLVGRVKERTGATREEIERQIQIEDLHRRVGR